MTFVTRPGEPSPGSLTIFAGVPEERYATLSRCEYREGDVLLAAGEEPDRLIILIRGSVAIKQHHIKVAVRRPVRLIGEQALLDGGTRSASVIAEDAVVTYETTGPAAEALMADPAFTRNVAEELNWKLREATDERAFRYRSEDLLFGAFRSHVSPEVLNDLLASGQDGRPRQADVVALFADVRGFTTRALTVSPAELAGDLGRFLDFAVDVIHRHGGLVDKFIGDEVMAVWGYAATPDQAERAFECAQELVSGAANLTLAGEPIRVGVGIESGIAVLGVIGGEGKRQFTAIGPPVNLAARLQAETKALDAPICVGPDLVARLPDEARGQLEGPVSREIRHVGNVDVWTYKGEGNDR